METNRETEGASQDTTSEYIAYLRWSGPQPATGWIPPKRVRVQAVDKADAYNQASEENRVVEWVRRAPAKKAR